MQVKLPAMFSFTPRTAKFVEKMESDFGESSLLSLE